MPPLTRLWRNLTRRSRVERDLDAELRATLEVLVAEKVAAGITPEEAFRAGAFLDTLGQDARYGVRILWRNPLFALTAALSMAIGIAAPTAIFTVANGLLLRAAPGVADPANLVDIVRAKRGDPIGVEEIAYPDYLDLRARAKTLEDVYGYTLQPDLASLAVDGSSERAFITLATANYFEALGVRAAAGRLFGMRDGEAEDGSPLAVLSHRFWTRRFNADPGIAGSTLRLNGLPFTIVGVADQAFRGTTVVAPDLWIPAAMVSVVHADTQQSPLTSRQDGWLMLGGRLKTGVTRAQASAEVRAIGAALAREFPVQATFLPPELQNVTFDWKVDTASPIPSGLRVIVATLLTFLIAIVSVVLVIACANVAGVLLTRAAARRREMAVRSAIGAGRRRIVRQLLTETMLLVAIGGAAGLAIARGLTSLLMSLLPAFPVPINVATPLDRRVIGFSLLLSVVAAVVAGLTPALQAAKTDVVAALKDDVPGASEQMRLRHAFVVAQVAFSMLLVLIAGILVRGVDSLASVNARYDEQGVDVATLDLSLGAYNETTGRLFVRELMERVRQIPGVETATIASPAGSLTFGGISVPGVDPPAGAPFFYPNWTIADSGYFSTLRIPLVAGRDIGPQDREGSERVVIVGERAARRFWPTADPLGQVLHVHTSGADGATASAPLRVVGVVRDAAPLVTPGSPATRPTAEGLSLYVPLQQRYMPQLRILTRTRGERSLAEDLRAVIMAMDPDLPVLSAQTLESQRTPAETQLRIGAAVAGSVGIVGVLLAAMGVYGVTAYTVTRRTREIGIRLSLGAGRFAVIRLVLTQGMRLIAVGSAAGMLMGIAAGVLLSGRFRIAPPDPLLFVAAAVLFALIGFVACYLPVRRATGIRAMDALRYE